MEVQRRGFSKSIITGLVKRGPYWRKDRGNDVHCMWNCRDFLPLPASSFYASQKKSIALHILNNTIQILINFE